MPSIHVDASTVEEVSRAAARLARVIGARPADLPTVGLSEQNGRPHLEYAGRSFALVVCERGTEFDRKSTEDVNLLLYWILKNAAFRLASDFELAHRVPHADSRRMLFAKQEELMALLDDGWAQRLAAEHAALLVKHPFRD